MEIRKVQMTGGSSYVVTLPKEWVNALNIKKNSPLGMIVQSDGTLLVTPRTEDESPRRTKEINVDQVESATYLFRLLIGAYIMGYSSIVVKSKARLPSFAHDCVTDFTQTVIGHEVIEEDMKSITTKDLLSPTEMSFEATIRRIAILVKMMHEDAVNALSTKDKSLANGVIDRDRDVDRLYWLISRQYNLALKDVTLSKRMGVTQEEATFYYMAGRLMERTADHAARMARHAVILMDKNLSKVILKTIASASELALKIFNDSIDSWAKRDPRVANGNIELTTELISYCEKLNRMALKVGGKSSISLGYISESLRRTGEYGANISEFVINFSL